MSDNISQQNINPFSLNNRRFTKKSLSKTNDDKEINIWDKKDKSLKKPENEKENNEIKKSLIENKKILADENIKEEDFNIEVTEEITQDMVENGISTENLKAMNDLTQEEKIAVISDYNEQVDEDTSFFNDCPMENTKGLVATLEVFDDVLEATESNNEIVAQEATDIIVEAIEDTLENDKYELTEHVVNIANDKSDMKCSAATKVIQSSASVINKHRYALINIFGYDWYKNKVQTILEFKQDDNNNETKIKEAPKTLDEKINQASQQNKNVREILESDDCRDAEGNLMAFAAHTLANKLIAHSEYFDEIKLSELSTQDRILIEAYYNRSGKDFIQDYKKREEERYNK